MLLTGQHFFCLSLTVTAKTASPLLPHTVFIRITQAKALGRWPGLFIETTHHSFEILIGAAVLAAFFWRHLALGMAHALPYIVLELMAAMVIP